MAVGAKRHYVIYDVATRHFIQSAEKAGIGRKLAIEVIEELIANAPSALERTLAALPGNFPREVTDSIAAALTSRTKTLADGLRENA
jgi:serine/threonine-protein kinase HipA